MNEFNEIAGGSDFDIFFVPIAIEQAAYNVSKESGIEISLEEAALIIYEAARRRCLSDGATEMVHIARRIGADDQLVLISMPTLSKFLKES